MNSFFILFQLKLALLKNSVRRLRTKSPSEMLTLIVFFAITGTGLFYFFFQSLRFFRGQEPFGTILITETFYLLNFTLFAMLLISSGISAYASLFESKEVDFLITKPAGWADIYFVKLAETLWHSSWSVLFLTIPFMTAYALNNHLSPVLFPLYALIFYIPFALLSCMLGTLAACLTVWLLPGRNHRRAALVAAVIGLGWWLHLNQPEFIKEQGSLAGIMMGYLPNVAFAKNHFLPSYWLSQGILGAASLENAARFAPKEGVFFLLLLLSNALFFFIPSYALSKYFYPYSFLKAQDHGGEGRKGRRLGGKLVDSFFDAFAGLSRPMNAFFEKDIKTFARNPAEWSQLIIFFGLLLFYFSNLRNLQFHVLKSFWKQIVFTLNTVGTYVVLSSFSMRVVFPMLSLEGSKSWVLGTAPIRFSSLLLEKFIVGMAASALLTLPLVYISGTMLEISHRSIAMTVLLGFFVCITLTGLSVGLGARFINFKSNNPTEIISGFGGSMLLITHLAYLTAVGLFLAFSKETSLWAFGLMAAASLWAGWIPLRAGARAMERMEF